MDEGGGIKAATWRNRLNGLGRLRYALASPPLLTLRSLLLHARNHPKFEKISKQDLFCELSFDRRSNARGTLSLLRLRRAVSRWTAQALTLTANQLLTREKCWEHLWRNTYERTYSVLFHSATRKA